MKTAATSCVSRALRSVAVISMLSCFVIMPKANAISVDNPHFKIDGLVIVWGASKQSGDKAQIGPRLTLTRTPQVQPSLSTLPPITGQLTPLPAKDLAPLDDRQQHFYVASNTAFSIDAELVTETDQTAPLLDNTQFSLSVSLGDGDIGQSAQYPHTGGARGGMATHVRTLADLTTSTRVFTGNQRTAARTGTIRQQSVRFDMTLMQTVSVDSSPSLAARPAPEILFTIFVP